MVDDMNFVDEIMNLNNMENLGEKDAMKKVMELMFAVNDMVLYLDTHPGDRTAIDLHKKYVNQYEKAKKYYEDNYGPLSIYSSVSRGSWVYDKWPWEGGRS